MTGETEEMVIPASWFQRMTRRQAYWILAAATTIGSVVSLQVYTYADMQRRLGELEAAMRLQVKEQGERNERQLMTLTQLTERMANISSRFDAVDARLTDIDRNVRRMAQ